MNAPLNVPLPRGAGGWTLGRLPLLCGCLIAALTAGPATVAAEELEINDSWKYTLDKPADGWQQADFDDSGWETGAGGFGTFGTPEARIGTEWNTPDIWLRRQLTLESVPETPALLVHHDEDTHVYINGQQVASLDGYTTSFQVHRLGDEAAQALRQGENLLAVHCHQTGGGQFIDVHLIDANNVPDLPPPNRREKPFETELITEWGAEVTPENVWQVYPRPAHARDNWTNLNGTWQYTITPEDQTDVPENWDGEILVPFALESKLSGVQRLLHEDEALWYRRTVEITPAADQRTLLNFEAVDYHAQVWVNGKKVGEHVGGNVPFSFDVSDAVQEGSNEILVRVEDDTEGFQLHGKQSFNPHAIWYTRVSGIWQTVWMEQVPRSYIEELDIATDVETGAIRVRPTFAGDASGARRWRLEVYDGDRRLDQTTGDAESLEIAIDGAKLWSPQSPHLYGLSVALLDDQGQVVDQVRSYAGIRSVGTTRDADGHLRMTLNGEVIFHWGPLDQGWWPDGLLTPPSPEAMVYDIAYLRDAGFNMIRKHIKVEPRVYYHACDQMGMMVWQDQVSGGENPPWTRLDPNPEDAQWSDEHHEQFMREFEEMIDVLEIHPSIVMWTPFNEAWGQHRTMQVGQWTLERDPSRLVNIASGGNFWPVGHIVDHHNYPHPDFPFDEERFGEFVLVVGEFGGHGLPVEGHLWDANRDNWGYGGLPKNAQEYKERYLESIRRLVELKERGIAAGVYTQTTDVEGEINGLMTYDRKVIKIPAEELKEIHQPLLQP